MQHFNKRFVASFLLLSFLFAFVVPFGGVFLAVDHAGDIAWDLSNQALIDGTIALDDIRANSRIIYDGSDPNGFITIPDALRDTYADQQSAMLDKAIRSANNVSTTRSYFTAKAADNDSNVLAGYGGGFSSGEGFGGAWSGSGRGTKKAQFQNVNSGTTISDSILNSDLSTHSDNRIYYNISNDTYIVNNITNNTTNNYYYQYNSTYITYVVETPEEIFVNRYFYELPDGRSSWNLNYSDIWGTVFAYDVKNYTQVKEDDGKTLGLWHFDGDVKDSSYWNNSYYYSYGASSNYAASPVDWGGALSWSDGGRHVLHLKLPSTPSSFTVEGRAYLSLPGDVLDIPSGAQIYTTWGSFTDGSFLATNYFSLLDSNSFSPSAGVNALTGYTYPMHWRWFSGSGWLSSFRAFNIPSFIRRYSSSGSGSSTGMVYWGEANTTASGATPVSNANTLVHYSAGASAGHSELWQNYSTAGMQGMTTVLDKTSGTGSDYPHDQWVNFALCVTPTTRRVYVNGMLISNDTGLYSSSGDEVILQSQGNTLKFDELRILNYAAYSGSSYVPSTQPWDTNVVYVLPSTGVSQDFAVASNIAAKDLRVGGVRPTLPANGAVYVHLDSGNKIDSVQQYQSDGWYDVTAAIYDGKAWVTADRFNMTPYIASDPVVPVATPTPAPTATPAPSSTPDPSASPAPSASPTPAPTDNGGGDSGDSVWDKVADAILGFLDMVGNIVGALIAGLLDIITKAGEAFTTLTSFGSNFTAFLSAYFAFMPPEIWAVVGAGLTFIIAAAILKILFK